MTGHHHHLAEGTLTRGEKEEDEGEEDSKGRKITIPGRIKWPENQIYQMT